MVYQWARNASWWLFPATCVLCGGPGVPKRDLCRGCYEDLPWNRHACPRCALPQPAAITPGTPCGPCQINPPPYDHAISVFRYEVPIDRLVRDLKFRFRLNQAQILGELMAERVVERLSSGALHLVPVPLHGSRLRARGFNQAAEITAALSAQLQLPVAAGLCSRQRATAEQTSLNAEERRRNLQSAFVVDGICPERIALVDDVHTTGSTLAELAHTLRLAGARHIEAWTCARAVHSEPSSG